MALHGWVILSGCQVMLGKVTWARPHSPDCRRRCREMEEFLLLLLSKPARPGLSRSVCRLGVRIGAESPNDGWFSFTAYIRFSLLVLKLGVHAPWEYS